MTSSNDRTRPLVLIMEDDWESRYLYCAYLSTTGFEVIEARDGFEAIESRRQRAGLVPLPPHRYARAAGRV